MAKESVVGWIGFLVIVLVVLGIAGVVLGVSMLAFSQHQAGFDSGCFIAGALFFLQATVSFGFALRSMTR